MKAWIAFLTLMIANHSLADQPTQFPTADGNVAKVHSTIRITTHRSKGWLIFGTPNFRVCTRNPRADWRQLARVCESLRSQLQSTWFDKPAEKTWSPRCDIILHPSLEEYRSVLGANVGRSVGCTTLELDGQRIVARRIDIRTDAEDWTTAALPHELTHVVLADRFAGRHIPRWADEGMGVLAEAEAKQASRLQALKNSAARGNRFTLQELLTLTHTPRRDHCDAFYGQSALLVQLLVERSQGDQFIEFVEQSLDHGYERALRTVYNIAGVAQLAQLCKANVQAAGSEVSNGRVHASIRKTDSPTTPFQ